MQFLNAFNDNVYKLVVSLLAVSIGAQSGKGGTYLSISGFIFILPFLLFSSYAGQMADRWEKRTVVIITKAIEIAAMIFALFALLSGSIEWMLAVLFFTATQAAIFSPAKYGIVPELVPERQLARANGLLEMSTFVAIILGTVVGSFLAGTWKNEVHYIGIFLVAVAILGTLASLRIARTPAPAVVRPFSWNPFGDVFTGLGTLAHDRTMLLSVLGTTYFWFLGALFQMILLLFGAEALHANETEIGLLMASLAIGIGVGSMAAGRLSGEKVEPGLVPIGAFGIAFGSFALAFGPQTLAISSALLIFTGFMSGLFVVPLNAMLQHRPHADEKGRILATANFVNTVGIMFASAVVWGLHEQLHMSAAHVIACSAALTLVATAFALYTAPDFTVRFIFWFLTHVVYAVKLHGKENVPQRGPALLVANHVSYVDGFLIGSGIQRFVRFMVGEVWYKKFEPIFKLFHAIPVPLGTKRAIVVAIQRAREELKNGHVVCIFAEGALTQTGNLAEFHRGLEHIVDGLDVPVIPVHLGGIFGSIFSLDRRASLWTSIRRLPWPISVSFGKPMMQPTAVEVRQVVSELGADAAHDAIDPKDSLGRQFVHSAKRNWSNRAMTDATGRTLSYGETLTASLLLADRIRKNHPDEQMMGIMLPASTAGAIVNLGIVLAGRVPVNLNFTIGKDALESAMSQCGLKTIFTSKQFLAKAKMDERPEMRFVEELLNFGKSEKTLQYLKARVLPARFHYSSKPHAEELAAVLFSSGSTGTPKGVMLSHRNLIANTTSVNSLFQANETDTVAGVLPLFHSFGFTYTLWFPLLNGAGVAYHAQPLDAKGLGALIEKTKATFLPAPPTFCQAYARGCTKEQFASLRWVLVGAEKLPAPLAAAFMEKFGLLMLEGYGATEMSPVISVNIPDREHAGTKQTGLRPGSVGQPVPGVAARVVHADTGDPLPVGQEGLLLVKGPNRMMGYLNRPEDTAKVIRDGWYVTGDIVVMDDEGFIKIVDRQSRFSKIGGEMVPHGKVEQTIQELLDGTQTVVTAVADDRKGERLVAFVASATVTPQEIWSKLQASSLPKLWIPKADDIRLVEALPVLGTGKVDLRKVKQMAMAAAAVA
jgi:acyl-[acyl-carrier-protein]-phospholipid O-acyltransferase/long-chain-fatty-acid--[acyl-carrier-protein] ligase